MADFLKTRALYSSEYSVASTPVVHTFTAIDVAITDEVLELKVTGAGFKI